MLEMNITFSTKSIHQLSRKGKNALKMEENLWSLPVIEGQYQMNQNLNDLKKYMV